MSNSTKAPVWFTVVAVILFLWNIMGVLSFISHSMINEAYISKLETVAEQELFRSYPTWTYIVFFIAVAGGFLGALMLVLKRKLAKPLFLISLVAILIQMTHNIFMTTSIEVFGAFQALLMPVMVIILGVVCLLLANMGIKKNWLR